MAWKVVSHPASFVGGLRSLIIQSLHPLAMAGVANHSDYKGRPLARLRRTAYYVAATTFGTTAQAHAAAARVRAVHSRIRGTDPVTGKAYSADDPETQLWVHNVEWHSFLVAYRKFGGRLSRSDEDRYLSEGARAASLLGVPESIVPKTIGELRSYWARMRPLLCVSEQARQAIDFVLDPPIMFDETLAYQVPVRISARAALALLPRYIRRIVNLPEPGAVEVASGMMIRSGSMLLRLPLMREAPSVFLGRETYELSARAVRAFRVGAA